MPTWYPHPHRFHHTRREWRGIVVEPIQRTEVQVREGAIGVKHVAARAGVSVGTVSNVLNRPDSVSEATRRKVVRAIAELGFVRNESGRQLRER